MIIVCKLIVMVFWLFIVFCCIGMMKMGADDFMVLLGGKVLGAWRWLSGEG